MEAPDRDQFNAKLEEILKGKQESNSFFISDEKYAKLIKEVNEAKARKGRGQDQRRLRQYDTVWVTLADGTRVERLIKPMKEGATRALTYVKNGDLYDRILEVHEDKNHVGRNKMMPLLNEKYVNITQETVTLFLALCGICQGKKKSKKKGIVVKPMVFKNMNDRCQVDLIDFQSSPDGDFKHIMNYQDHLTKFVILNPLKSKTAQEVALNLVNIFLTFGAPVILQSDNGREFVASWIEKLKILFPGLKIVHGTPRHSQSQGSVERANQTVQDRLWAWMLKTKTREWARGLPFVQYSINTTMHEGIRRSPYEAMFGAPHRLGLASMFPLEDVAAVYDEKDFEKFLKGLKTAGKL